MKSNTLNLTAGNITKLLVIYTLPLIGTNLLQSLYSIADLLIAGQTVGSIGISAINNASQIINLITKIAIGLSIGGNILIGQHFGAKDKDGTSDSAATLFSVCLLFGVLTAVGILLFSRDLLQLLDAPALNEADTYLKICAAGFIFIWGYNGLSAVLRAFGDSKSTFYIITASSIINIFLDILLMAVLHMGVTGAAVATTLSQAISFLLALLIVLGNRPLYGISLRHPKFYIDKFLGILHLGIPTALQMTIAAFSWLTVTYYINHYGVDVSAGNGISIKIKDTCQLVLSAISTGTSTMIAQNLGAALYDRSHKILKKAMTMSIAASVILMLIVELTAPLLAGFFTNEPAVLEAAVLNLRIEMIGQIFYAIFLIYHGFMTGAGHTLIVMLSSFTNCILVRVVLVYFLEARMGLPGIYLACMIAPFASVPIGFIYVRSGIWKRSLVKK